MSISKKIRFEVFKRDGFRCAYCGKTPPTIILEIDHIEPKSMGGQDDINNLVTSCFDCNRGKAHIPLETVPQQLADNLGILKEKRLQMKEYSKWVQKIDADYDILISRVETIFKDAFPDCGFNQKHRNHVREFIEGAGMAEIEKAMRIATNKFFDNPQGAWKYFCGISWRRVRGIKSPYEEGER